MNCSHLVVYRAISFTLVSSGGKSPIFRVCVREMYLMMRTTMKKEKEREEEKKEERKGEMVGW